MYGQASSNGQWGSGGYSRSSLGLDPPQSGNDWSNQNYNSNTQSQNWHRSNYEDRNSDTAWSNTADSSYHQSRSRSKSAMDVDNSYSNQSDGSATWSKPTSSRKRSLLMEEDDYPRSGSGYSRSRSGQWPRSEDRSNTSNRQSWNESGGRTDDWSLPNNLSKRPPWSKSSTTPSLLGSGRDNASRFSESLPTTNSWSKPDNFSKPSWSKSYSDSWDHTAMPISKPWENRAQNQDGANRFTQKSYSQFGRPFFSRGDGFKPKPKPQIDVKSVLESMVTTYYVNQEKVNMPKELTSKFEPLKCDLCAVSVNSTVTAKTHYSGKMHDKKVVQFMQKWFAEKGQPLPDQFKEGVSRKPAVGQVEEMRALYCNVCNIPLTSKQHAEQHYMGKAHKKALEAGGVKKQIPSIVSDPSGRFTFGTRFVKNTDPLGLKEPEAKTNNPYVCEACNVSTTSKEQLDVHLGGSRHRRKVNPLPNPTANPDKQKIPPPAAKGDTILETVVKRPKGAGRKEKQDGTDEKKKDFSIFRTPSGQFYCATCNVTMNSESQFGQHNDSKRHKLNVTNGGKVKNSGANSSVTGKSVTGATATSIKTSTGTTAVAATTSADSTSTSGTVDPVA